jgi:anaerobic magnesium-protoporphyrin IX monomethyl ester cyclase
MNILVIAAARSRFNYTLHYRYTDVGEVLGYLAQKRPQDTVTFYDSLAYEIDWYVLRAVAAGIQVLIFFTDVSSAPVTYRLAQMARAVQPEVKIVVYGKAPLCIPQYFTRAPFDAVYVEGDQEAALLSYLDYLEGGALPKGIWCAQLPDQKIAGVRLSADEWGYPDLERLPLADYRRIARVKGIPFELSVYPSKGCSHLDCGYCDAPRLEGLKDRRRDPQQLLSWIAKAIRDYGFEYVQMHSTNFCAAPDWVEQFCAAYQAGRYQFKWTCCARVDAVSASLAQAMAKAGCERIGLGVETLLYADAPQQVSVKTSITRLEQVAVMLHDAGLKGKAYMMAGIPGQSEVDLLFTYLAIRRLKLIPRVSTYTPFQDLHGLSVSALQQLDLERYDRKSFLPEGGIPAATILKLILRPPDVDAWVQERFDSLRVQAAIR